MRFRADLHIHSKYSRACSRDCDLPHLAWWARRKGLTLLGTGDFTHPAWFEHLRESLVPAEPGLFRLRPDLDADVKATLPPLAAAAEVRFMLSVEISTIYKRADRTRKVHHLVYVPDFAAATAFTGRLGRIGNLGSDGRPILGLDSRDLLEITLESGEGCSLVPAHVWTPWFAVLGSRSGFDAIEDCYLDLAGHITAVETGLSSDPAMNWRISALDRYRLVSNSDAHSPPMLGREATMFDTDLDYAAVHRALRTGDGHEGTIEFFPEEGKYHVDGHRACGVRMDPGETRARGGTCPACGRPVTVGVLSRVEELADRPEGYRRADAGIVASLVPLPEITAEILGVGPRSKRVTVEVERLVAALGPELGILQDIPVDDIAGRSSLLAEAVDRLRRGEVIREAGYDGTYGVIRLFRPGELTRPAVTGVSGLFDEALVDPGPSTAAPAPTEDTRPEDTRPEDTRPEDTRPERPRRGRAAAAPAAAAGPADPVEERRRAPSVTGNPLLAGLDPEQRAAAADVHGPLLVVAGPGTGKTRTLTHRLAHLVTAHGVPPEHCLAITFTRRAAEEMTGRLAALVPAQAPRMTVTTFHALGVRILREHHDRVGLGPDFAVADEARQLAVAREVTGDERPARRLLQKLPGRTTEAEPDEAVERYRKALRQADLVDFDDLVALPVTLLESDPDVAAAYRDRFRWICVDEYQDVDERQYRLLRQLAPADGNLTAIGDPDQAIYRFRGADVGFFLRFRQDFPGARTVRLTRNYRSTPSVLTAALRVVAPTTLVPDRVLRPVAAAGDAPVGLHRAATEQAEASFVARTIDRLLGGSSFHSLDSGRVESGDARGLGFADFAVLYRTERQADALVAAFTRAGVPFQRRSHDRLADRPGVGRVVEAVAAAPPGPVVDRLYRARDDLLRRPAEPGRDTETDDAEIRTAVELLAPLARCCGDDLRGFRTELALGVEVDTLDPRADRVSLLTLHAAKGLEFPVVFVVGCEDGLLPLRWSGSAAGTDGEHVREERRLLFVGMTRARRHLYLSHVAERHSRGAARASRPSPFLGDLPTRVCQESAAAVPRRHPREPQLRLL